LRRRARRGRARTTGARRALPFRARRCARHARAGGARRRPPVSRRAGTRGGLPRARRPLGQCQRRAAPALPLAPARAPRAPGRPATAVSGGFAWLIPLAPLAALAAARDPRRRLAALALAGWTTVFGALALAQVRFGSDYAPSGALGFALCLDAARRALARRLP